jgi:hypothetical protein
MSSDRPEQYLAWSMREYESTAKRPKQSTKFCNPRKPSVRKTDLVQLKPGFKKLDNGQNDLPASSSHSESDKREQHGYAKRRFSDEFRQILLNPITETIVDWENEIDQEENHQNHLYTILAKGGVVRVKNIPKIPLEYDIDSCEFYGIDTEDDSHGMPHFFQFASRDEVIFSSSWPVMLAWLSRHSPYNLSGAGHVIWGTNIEYELGNIIKQHDASKESLDVRWSKANLTKYEIMAKHAYHDWMQKTDSKLHLKIWDTLNHWKKSVRELGRILTSKLNYEFDKLDFDPYSFKYAAMDAIISRSYACVQREYYKKKNLKLLFTPGATALCAYTQGYHTTGEKFCNHRLYNSHDEEELRWLIGSLRGGRTEVFSLKEYNEPVGYYDINSAYPYAMKLGDFPNIAWHKWETGHENIAKLISSKVEGVVDCDVYADRLEGFTRHIPYLGTLDTETNRFIFPIGTWRGKYTLFEIRKALKLGYTFKYHKACFYSVCNTPPFKDYVAFCYAIRDEGSLTGDSMLRDIGKSLGNNLFGKFGQRMQTSELVKIDSCNPEDIEGCIIIDDSVIVSKDEGFAKHTNVVWSAYITAMCRDLLYMHMMRAWASGNEILYCDTDSIFIVGGKPPESHQTNLGALKHEGDLAYFRAYLPKVYAYEFAESKRSYKAKGVPYTERERFIVQGKAEYKKPMKIREALRRTEFNTDVPVEPGIPAINAWIHVEKELKGAYTKRKTLKDGSTEPICLSMKKDKEGV